MPPLRGASANYADRLANDRDQLLEMIKGQRKEVPLQLLENLSRGSRQVGTLAAIFSVEANRSRPVAAARQALGVADRSPSGAFVETGIRSVLRQANTSVSIEPFFKILKEETGALDAQNQCGRPPIFVPPITKSEMLVETLLTALGDRPIDEGSDSSIIRPISLAPDESSTARPVGPVMPDLKVCLDNAGVSSNGFAVTTPSREPNNPPDREIDANTLAGIVSATGKMEQADFVRLLATRSEEAAQFLNFVDHALLIRDPSKSEPCQHYEYTDDFVVLAEQAQEKGSPWMETFLSGIEGNIYPKNGLQSQWRIHCGDSWRIADSRREVLDHVFMTAIGHLFATEPSDPSMPVYPLVTYELLGNAIGQAVPEYLKQHEQHLLSTLQANKVKVEDRIATQRESLRVDQELRAQATIANRQRVRDNHVHSLGQLHFCNDAYIPIKVTGGSLDRMIALAPVSNDRMGLVRAIQAKLELTHVRQAVSYVDHNMKGRDNLCWLRSGWLSIFSSLTPEQIGERFEEIQSAESASSAKGLVLAQIAHDFHINPTQFMHCSQPPNTIADGAQMAARLGTADRFALPSASGIPAQHTKSVNESIETWLKNLQCDIVSNFRFEDSKIMNEIEALDFPRTLASSDMLINLHRAFHASSLIIECGVNDTFANQDGGSIVSVQFRVAAVEKTPLADLLDPPENETSDGARVRAESVLQQFAEQPVIWLEREHFEIYFPKSAYSGRNQLTHADSVPDLMDFT